MAVTTNDREQTIEYIQAMLTQPAIVISVETC